jgi:hypothetical protein
MDIAKFMVLKLYEVASAHPEVVDQVVHVHKQLLQCCHLSALCIVFKKFSMAQSI